MRFIPFTVLLIVTLISTPAHAQLAGQDLPNLNDLREVFGDVASGATEVEEIRQDGGLLGSGIEVPDTGARGNMAKALGDLIGQEVNNFELSEVLEKAFIEASLAVEDALPELGFQKRDYGVGFALFFILSWEMANETTLEVEASKVAGGNIVRTIQAAGAGQDVAPEELDAGYDLFLTIPVALLALVQAYEAEGRMTEAAQMRKIAADAFVQIVGLSPYDIDITDAGEIIGY